MRNPAQIALASGFAGVVLLLSRTGCGQPGEERPLALSMDLEENLRAFEEALDAAAEGAAAAEQGLSKMATVPARSQPTLEQAVDSHARRESLQSVFSGLVRWPHRVSAGDVCSSKEFNPMALPVGVAGRDSLSQLLSCYKAPLAAMESKLSAIEGNEHLQHLQAGTVANYRFEEDIAEVAEAWEQAVRERANNRSINTEQARAELYRAPPFSMSGQFGMIITIGKQGEPLFYPQRLLPKARNARQAINAYKIEVFGMIATWAHRNGLVDMPHAADLIDQYEESLNAF